MTTSNNCEYDVIVLGLGPAGMAVSAMAAEMGLRVAAIEPRKIGGECMNVGCIPSKALLRIAKTRHTVARFPDMSLAPMDPPAVVNPFEKIGRDLKYINEAKTRKMFEKVDLFLEQGPGAFVDAHTVSVGEVQLRARRIFIAVGTKPMVPPIPGLDSIDYLTNENVFQLASIPNRMTIIGGGAIGCEMAQAFARLGSKVTIVHMDAHLVPIGEPKAAALLEERFADEGIAVFNSRKIEKVAQENGEVAIYTDRGERIVSDRLLVGAGRKVDLQPLKLEHADVAYTRRGITVDRYLRTSQKHIYAVGDCNGHYLLSHAAMHQGMIALMNAMMPWPFKRKFERYVVPWTVFTEPQISHVGMTEKQLQEKGRKFESIEVRYEDYGAAIAEGVADGYVRVHTTAAGRILGVGIVGEGSGEMINEWALAMHTRSRMHTILTLQHSFPTMGFLSKRAAETWMMKRMQSSRLRRMMQFMFRTMARRAPTSSDASIKQPEATRNP
jgi:pyruvate/2-oxoglutarate dehydrogenase complex dihydrolipoamide dehydrogenase (E3) component